MAPHGTAWHGKSNCSVPRVHPQPGCTKHPFACAHGRMQETNTTESFRRYGLCICLCDRDTCRRPILQSRFVGFTGLALCPQSGFSWTSREYDTHTHTHTHTHAHTHTCQCSKKPRMHVDAQVCAICTCTCKPVCLVLAPSMQGLLSIQVPGLVLFPGIVTVPSKRAATHGDLSVSSHAATLEPSSVCVAVVRGWAMRRKPVLCLGECIAGGKDTVCA